MSVIVGAASITQSNEDLRQRVTADKFSEYLAGLHTLPMLNWKEIASGTTQASTTTRIAVLAASGARPGDLLLFTSGALAEKFVGVRSVATTAATLAFEMEGLTAGVGYTLLRVQPVSATNPLQTTATITGSIPLPTGASTAALQSNVQETDPTYGTFLKIGIPWFDSGGPSSGIGPWPVLGDGMYASYPGVALVARQPSGGGCVPLFADTSAPSSGADALGVRAVCYGIDGATNRVIKLDSTGQVYVVGAVDATPADRLSQSGTITASAQSVTLALLGANGATVLVRGTYSALNGIFEASWDGGITYFTVQAYRLDSNTIETTTGSISNTARGWKIGTRGATDLRLRATAFTSGTANVEIYAAYFEDEPIPGIGSHAVTLTSTTLTSVVPGTAATNLGKAIDAVPGATDTGVACLMQRVDAPGTLTPASNDYALPRIDSNGRQWIHDAASRFSDAAGGFGSVAMPFGYISSGTRTVQAGSTATVIQVNTDATTLCRRGDILQVTTGTFAQGLREFGFVSAVTATTITLESPGFAVVPAATLTVTIWRPTFINCDISGNQSVSQATTPWTCTPYTGAKLNFEAGVVGFAGIGAALATVLSLGNDSVELNLSNTTDVELTMSMDGAATTHTIPADSQFKFTCTAMGGNINAGKNIQVRYETVAPTRGRFSVLSAHY